MDYTQANLKFKVRKTLRYVRLYGVPRTWIKVRGQYHMKRRYDDLPPARQGVHPGNVALVGCGNFAFTTLAYYLRKNYGRVLRAAMDHNLHRAASLFEHYGLAYYTDDFSALLADPNIDLIYIASNHASHAEYAIAALEQGKAVHIEKPHVVNHEQLQRLCASMERTRGKVNLGFNRPQSFLGLTIQQSLAAEGGAAMLNWFIVGHEIPPDHWYLKPEEGGHVLGNLCHWTDFAYSLIPAENRYPILITPTRAEKSDCDISVTLTFGDGSIAAITFSARGHTFEGVRERFAAQRGNTLVTMDDFRDLTIEVGENKREVHLRHRDHGHEGAVRRSYELVRPGKAGCSVAYVWEAADLFLSTRTALEENRIVRVEAYRPVPAVVGI